MKKKLRFFKKTSNGYVFRRFNLWGYKIAFILFLASLIWIYVTYFIHCREDFLELIAQAPESLTVYNRSFTFFISQIMYSISPLLCIYFTLFRIRIDKEYLRINFYQKIKLSDIKYIYTKKQSDLEQGAMFLLIRYKALIKVSRVVILNKKRKKYDMFITTNWRKTDRFKDELWTIIKELKQENASQLRNRKEKL